MFHFLCTGRPTRCSES